MDMDIVLSHTTALEVMRRPYYPGRLAQAMTCPVELPARMPARADLLDACERCPQLDGASLPVHVLISDAGHRHRFSMVAPHACRLSLPPGSLVPLAPGVRCVSPPLLAVQMAPRIDELELVVLLAELLGTYALSPASPLGLEQRRAPLVTRDQLLAFLDACGPVPGTAQVRAALSQTPVGAASPMESKLFVRGVRRFASGGYRLGEVALNDPVLLESLSRSVPELRVRKPDLLLLASGEGACPEGRMPFSGVALDYHGEWHADPVQVRRDTERANELMAHGIKDYVIWKESYDDIDYMDALMDNVRRDLGLPPRKLSRERARGERAARVALWAELERIDGLHWSGLAESPTGLLVPESPGLRAARDSGGLCVCCA
ncbi:hypothetical protein [Olsenella profusa]|uniref:DUF559 domain-containing protein n=1 Tax=Olsenella profusa TaxID=138595 RepID=A0ABS2F400_9ACTN|nr:hypothetical protein [Olsenella profusa]MBM6775502.1 hypothetical protein [Olsenella profusa]